MPSDSSTSARPSARTSRSGRTSRPSEAEFLARQADDAKASIVRVTDQIKHDLAQTVNPRAWVSAAPWTTLASAAVAGFAAAAMLIPSKEQQALRRLRKIEEAIQDTHERNGNESSSGKERRSTGSLLASLTAHAFQLLQPMLTTAITALLSSRAAASAPDDGARDAPTEPSTAKSDI